MKKNDSTTPDSKSADQDVQTKEKEKCQHFSIRGYAADMRQKNSKAGNPFNQITDSKWEQIRPPLYIPQFRCWDCANCVRDISISSTSTGLPKLRENSRTLNGDKNSLLICLKSPDKDCPFENTVAKEANGEGNRKAKPGFAKERKSRKAKLAAAKKRKSSASVDIRKRARKKSRPTKKMVEINNPRIAATCTLSLHDYALGQRGLGESNLSALSHSSDELCMEAVDQALAYIREHPDELPPDQNFVDGRSELPPDHPVAEQTQHNLINVMIDLVNIIYDTNGPEKVKNLSPHRLCVLNSDPSSFDDSKELMPHMEKTERSLVGEGTVQNLGEKCRYLHDMIIKFPVSEAIKVVKDKDVFKHNRNKEAPIYILPQDVVDFLRMAWSDMPILQILMMYIHKLCQNFNDDSFGFMCPSEISLAGQRPNLTTEYMTNVLADSPTKRFILAPFFQDHHWMLLLICCREQTVYLFDSLKRKQTLHIVELLKSAYKVYATSDLRKQNSCELNWYADDVQCPQQKGGTECCYYVMRYMYDIVTLYHKDPTIDWKEGLGRSYTEEQIDEIREIWADYFTTECL